MSNDPWTIQEERNQTSQFVQTEMEIEEISGVSETGKPWSHNKIKVSLTPIESGERIKEYNTRDFVLDWQKITLPSIFRLIALKKLSTPSEMQNKQFCEIRWDEYRDRDGYRVTKKKADGYEKYVLRDEHGEYINYLGVNFLAVFATEDEWKEAASQAEENPQPASIEKEQSDDLPKVLKSAVVGIISDSGTDMIKLEDRLNSDQFAAFDIQGDFVKSEVAKMVMARTGTSPEDQEEMLAEINSHFNGDTPYLKAEDIPEIPF